MEKILVFGFGAQTKRNWESIIKKYEVVAILDNKIVIGENQEYQGVWVCNPFEYKKIKNIPILVMIYDYTTAVRQLKEMGVPSANIRIINGKYDMANMHYVTCLDIDNVIALPSREIDADWGYRRGTPIGRIYIEQFLEKYKLNIKGDIMEIAETTYSKQFSNPQYTSSYTAIHVDDVEGCRKANLETGEGLHDKEFDTMIITQTLAYIYDLRSVVSNIFKSLKNDGYCLVTVTDIGHMGAIETESYGAYWGFHRDGISRLFAEAFGEENICTETYGNLKAIVAQLYGLAAEDMDNKCLYYNDSRYPMIIGIVAHKVE